MTTDGLLPLRNCAAEGLSIRISTDGAPVSLRSPAYTGPVTLTKTTTIAAAVEFNGTLHPLVHTATFTKRES